jgi:glycosyltransferase involved in cell wall biosynthesis
VNHIDPEGSQSEDRPKRRQIVKVLFLVQDEQTVILDALYDAVCAHCECDFRRLSSQQQSNLATYFAHEVKVQDYDRILFFLRFKKELQQINFIRSVPNLVSLEHDACQNYAPGKYQGSFSYYYKSIPWIRVICSGYSLAERLRSENIDAVCVPKGYDQTLLYDQRKKRDIELGFLGSLGAKAYAGRKAMLEALVQYENLQIMKTAPGKDYRECLNRIRFFVSADVGLDEYMIKNFEVMACGCVLFTYDQGEFENRCLGFVDMHNVVLYRTLPELREKLAYLRSAPEIADRVAIAGRELVETRYSFGVLGKQIVAALEPPLLRQQDFGKRGWHEIIKLQWQRYLKKLQC